MSNGRAEQMVLVVDDEHALADTLAAIIRSAGYQSKAAYSASEAMDLLKTIKPCLIISDVMMPDINGVDFAMQAHKLFADVQILLISGHAGTQDLVEAARSIDLSFEFMAKPVPPVDLLAKVADMLERTQLRDF